MIVSVMHQRGVGIQEAINVVAEWYRQRAAEFITAMNDIPETEDPKVNEDVRKYVAGLGHWATANYEWSFETERYWGENLNGWAKNNHEVDIEMLPPRFEITLCA